MGSLFSSNPQPMESDTLPIEEPRRFPYNGIPVPAEASTAPGDSETWYADFFEKAYCAPHKDGKNVIICWPNLPRGHVRDYRELEGWPVVKVRLVYEHLGGDHPRIVRYVGELEDGSLVVEKLSPGPFGLRLPVMTVPVPETPSPNDKVMLSLYYRWALQGLAALSFVHSHSIYLRTFSAQQIWLRSDYSLAITGFINADITGDKTDYGEGGMVTDESMPYDETALHGSVKEDLFYWATFVWRLMTNDYTEQSLSVSTHCWEPVCPVEGCDPSNNDNEQIFCDRLEQELFQELEEARLGRILVKAWKNGYSSADEAAEEIRAIASKKGIAVQGDEVHLDKDWADIFEVVQRGSLPSDGNLKFK